MANAHPAGPGPVQGRASRGEQSDVVGRSGVDSLLPDTTQAVTVIQNHGNTPGGQPFSPQFAAGLFNQTVEGPFKDLSRVGVIIEFMLDNYGWRRVADGQNR